jgi:DUF4097 and DUF4098 domain-containing protein YvlB
MRRTLSRLALLAALAGLAADPATAESRMEKTLQLAPGGTLTLDTDLGGVTVTGKAASDVHLVVTGNRDLDDLLTFRFDESAGSVTIVARRKRRFSSWSGNSGRVRYEIEVPTQTALDIETSGGKIAIEGIGSRSKLSTSGGGIQVTNLVGDLEADTSGGPIHLRDIKGRMRVQTSGGGIDGVNLDGQLFAETSGGSIELERVAGDIDASSSGGGISIVGAGGRVKASTSGGGIEASFAKGNASGGSLETSGGGIEVALDPEIGVEIDAEGNNVQTDLPVRIVGKVSRRSLRGSLGKGGEMLRLRTSGGGVWIKSL